MSWRLTYKQAILLLFMLHLSALSLFAGFRIVDPDEGFYLTAAHKVTQGQSLYADFFYPQMPFLPYILAPFSGHGFATLYLSRFAGVAASACAAILLYLVLGVLCRDQRIKILVFALYLFSGHVLTWHSVAKTYPWTDLFLLASVYLMIKMQTSNRLWLAGAAGVFLALAINTRLVFVPLAVIFAMFVYMSDTGRRFQRLGLYAAAVAIISIPSLLLLGRFPGQFLFDNLGFHLMREPQTIFPQTMIDRLVVIGRMLVNPQIFILALCIGMAIFTWRRTKGTVNFKSMAASPAGLITLTALAIIVIYLIPTPIHQEYFVQAVPFALLASAAGLNRSPEKTHTILARPFVRKALMAVYLLGIIPYAAVFIFGLRQLDHINTIANVRGVCDYLQTGNPQGAVLAEWPIFPTLAGCESLDDAAFVGYDYKLPLTDQQKKWYRLPTDSGLMALLADRKIARLVVRDFPDSALQPLVAQNYVKEQSFDRYVVYGRK